MNKPTEQSGAPNAQQSIEDLREQLKSIEERFLGGIKSLGAVEWERNEERARELRITLFRLTGDSYGNPKKTPSIRPSEEALNAEYSHPDEVPVEVMAWVRNTKNIITSDGTDVIRWARIADSLDDERYSSGSVTLYRAVPPGYDGIRPGDWVTTSLEYAQDHNDRYFNGRGSIEEIEVDGRDVLCSPTGNYEEAIYAPRDLSGPPASVKRAARKKHP
jgi:hypothetical protein